VFKGFKEFLLRGNVVDLAVAVVVGAAFNGVVQAMVKDLITPLISAIGGTPDFSKQSFQIHKSIFLYGDFVNAFISFLLIAGVVYFFVVSPINRLVHIMNRGKDTEDPTTRKCPECLSEIPNAAKRCKFCTAEVDPQMVPVEANA
jgi:large conductance mechanosensitive channel